MFEIKGQFSTAKVMIDDVEESCVGQIHQFLNHPAFTNPVAIMPDAHAGKGSCIGFTMEMTDKVVVSVVGVDIGCGMLSGNIGKNLPISIEELDSRIRDSIPFGKEIQEDPTPIESFPWRTINGRAEKFAVAYQDRYGIRPILPKYDVRWFLDKCDKLGVDKRRAINSIGTLGGGNHFIETGIDLHGDIWITVHSGSSKFGESTCRYWQNIAAKRFKENHRDKAKSDIEEARSTLEGPALFKRVQDIKKNTYHGLEMKGMEWLEREDAANYLFDMIFAQEYASVNRHVMASIIKKVSGVKFMDSIESVHNFIDFNDFIIRKGSIRSYELERMLIPFNMRDGILICEGKTNPEWNFSAPHGAGRLMSRSKAKKELDLDTFKKQMEGIYSTSVCNSTLDEAPNAYKDSKVIENAIGPTATILNRIKPIHNMKDKTEFKRRKKHGRK